MRLHSDFHDYYDNAIGYGIDEKVYYSRFQTETNIVLKTKNDRPNHYNAGLIGYCGNTFPFIKLQKWDRRFRYTRDEAEPILLDTCFAYNLEVYKQKQEEWSQHSNDFGYWDRSRELKLKQFFTDWAFQDDSIFRNLKVPLWVLKFQSELGVNGIVNPRLKDYQFDLIRDSTSAFQEISVYLANVLIEQKEVVMIEDVYRIQQHGFDLKNSFRSTKDKKKR